MQKYQSTVRTVTAWECDHIKSFLKDTVRYEPYNSSIHVGYNFNNSIPPAKDGPNRVTEPQFCGDFSKDILKTDLFPNSLFKCIRGTSTHSIAALCNSDSKLLMSGEKVKDILGGKYHIPTDVAFMAAPAGKWGYRYCKLTSPDKLNKNYGSNKTFLKSIISHTNNPSMTSYNQYISAVREGYLK